jgi:hypothetical protein
MIESNSWKKIAIAGTAGRKEDADKLHPTLYASMQDVTLELIQRIIQPGESVHLISGGAAYADHLAVRLFLAGHVQKLTLHLPCEWDPKRKTLADTGEFNWVKNPGGTANALHRAFQRKIKINPFEEIAQAIADPRCEVTVSKGFHARNSLMAEADVLIAETFGKGCVVKDGGTANTCETYLKRIAKAGLPDLSWHIDLNQSPPKAHAGIKLPEKPKAPPVW